MAGDPLNLFVSAHRGQMTQSELVLPGTHQSSSFGAHGESVSGIHPSESSTWPSGKEVSSTVKQQGFWIPALLILSHVARGLRKVRDGGRESTSLWLDRIRRPGVLVLMIVASRLQITIVFVELTEEPAFGGIVRM